MTMTLTDVVFPALLALLLPQTLYAQPILTAASGPAPGNSVILANLNDVPNLCTGPNCVWDLTAQATTTTAVVDLLAPSAVPESISFPTATVVAVSTGSPTKIFLRNGPYGLSRVGLHNGQPFVDTDPLELLVYPCTYLTTWTDTYASPMEQGTRTYLADGYGTLVGPAGTLTNVLKIHSEYSTGDTMVNGVHYTGVLFEDVFRHPSIPWPVANTFWDRLYADGQLINEQKVGSVINVLPVGILSQTTADLGLHATPNPVTDRVLLQYTPGAKRISVFDATGRCVLVETTNGSTSYLLDLSSLTSGGYSVVVVDSNGLADHTKLLKQ